MVISPLTESHVITCHVCGIHYHVSITTLTLEMEFDLAQTYFGTIPYLNHWIKRTLILFSSFVSGQIS